MDIFRDADLEERKEALNDALAVASGRREDQEDQEKKDADYNEKLQGITEPIAQELLRKPVEDLAKKAFGKVSGAIRSRVAGGLRSAGRQVASRLQDQATRLGVNAEDLEALRSGQPSRIAERFTARTTGRATSAIPEVIDDDTRRVVNIGRGLRGRTPLPPQPTGDDGEAVEVDAFTGRPIVRQEETPRPTPTDEVDDWTAQLYDQPITHEADLPSRIPSTRPPVSLASDPEDPTARVVANRLNSIFGNTDYSSLPTPSFRPPPSSAPAIQGDTQVLDQLAPMREASRIQASGISPRQALQNRSILDQYRNATPDLREDTTPAVQAEGDATSGPATPQQPTVQGQVEEPQVTPESSAPAPRSEPATGTGDSNVDGSSSRSAGQQIDRTIEQNAGRDLESNTLRTVGESELALGGPEDPLADVVGLVAGLGTLFGGLFGGHHTDVVSSDATSNAVAQQGVY